MARRVHCFIPMELRHTRLFSTLFAAAALFFAAPSFALDFQVHGYDLGERIELQSGRQVWTAELDVSLETVADHVSSFCVDLDTYIGVATYTDSTVLDAYTAPPGPSPSGDRDFAWAAHVMTSYGQDLEQFVDHDTTRDQAITGVQAAIWEGLYGGVDDTVNRGSLSGGAQQVFDQIMLDHGLPNLTGISNIDAIIVDLPTNQDQVLVVSAPVPEPSAALVFGLGTIFAGSALRRRD